MRVTSTPRQRQLTAAEPIVIPRRCSCAIQSLTVEPSSTDPGRRITPPRHRSCSVSVVLPASMCATIPRLRRGLGEGRVMGLRVWGQVSFRARALVRFASVAGRFIFEPHERMPTTEVSMRTARLFVLSTATTADTKAD